MRNLLLVYMIESIAVINVSWFIEHVRLTAHWDLRPRDKTPMIVRLQKPHWEQSTRTTSSLVPPKYTVYLSPKIFTAYTTKYMFNMPHLSTSGLWFRLPLPNIVA